jgi:hypothetical protein
MTLAQHQQAFALDVSKLIDAIYKASHSCTFGEAYRTDQQAAWDVCAGIGIKNSLHCKRLAVDLNLFNELGDYCPSQAQYNQFGDIWESYNPLNRWGGNFARGDANHFERNAPL